MSLPIMSSPGLIFWIRDSAICNALFQNPAVALPCSLLFAVQFIVSESPMAVLDKPGHSSIIYLDIVNRG